MRPRPPARETDMAREERAKPPIWVWRGGCERGCGVVWEMRSALTGAFMIKGVLAKGREFWRDMFCKSRGKGIYTMNSGGIFFRGGR